MYDGGLSIETYLAGAGKDVASIVDNEQLKCTASVTIYIYIYIYKTSDSAVSRKNFSVLLLHWFYEEKFKFLGFYVVVLVKAFTLIYQLPM